MSDHDCAAVSDTDRANIVTPCHRSHWRGCPRVDEFHRHIEGMTFRACNDRGLWQSARPERWVDAIEQDASNVRTLCRVGIIMGIFASNGHAVRIVDGCPLAAEVMRHACKVDKEVLSASIAVRVGIMGRAAREADRLSIMQTIMRRRQRDEARDERNERYRAKVMERMER